jgi:hypothetical protein
MIYLDSGRVINDLTKKNDRDKITIVLLSEKKIQKFTRSIPVIGIPRSVT